MRAQRQALSLALPLRADYPQNAGSGRFNIQHVMTQTGTDSLTDGAVSGYSDDAIAMSVHGHTHWDAVAHVFHRGRMFNDRSAAMVTARGAAANDVTALARTLVTRSVLLDLAPDGDSLARDHEVTVAQLEEAADRQHVTIQEGDALLLRTGHLGAIRRSGRWMDFCETGRGYPFELGLGHACLPWLHERGVAAVASDNWAVELLHGAATERLPVHEIAVAHMGMPLGQISESRCPGRALRSRQALGLSSVRKPFADRRCRRRSSEPDGHPLTSSNRPHPVTLEVP